jgi:hypothetical protein
MTTAFKKLLKCAFLLACPGSILRGSCDLTCLANAGTAFVDCQGEASSSYWYCIDVEGRPPSTCYRTKKTMWRYVMQIMTMSKLGVVVALPHACQIHPTSIATSARKYNATGRIGCARTEVSLVLCRSRRATDATVSLAHGSAVIARRPPLSLT